MVTAAAGHIDLHDAPCGRAAASAGDDVARCAVLVRGLSEIASAIAHALFASGYRVALHNGPGAPKTHRRLMSFADAFFDEAAVLDGVTARRVETSTPSWTGDLRGFIPVLLRDFAACLDAGSWDVVVDARMQKRAAPQSHVGLAALTIGVGPGHVAGETADLAVETSWGDRLGVVIRYGSTLPLAGEPRPIEGVGRERNIYASAAGVVRSGWRIGEPMARGDVVAWLGEYAVRAPISGTLRGLVRPGVAVSLGDKIVEIDPRPPHAASFKGLGERPRLVAAGILSAIREWQASRVAGRSA